MHTASDGKLFATYVSPAVTAMIVNGIYSVIDGIFIGQAVGAEGLAAAGIAWPIFAVMIGVGMMIGMGAGSYIGLYRGRGDDGKAGHIIGNTLSLLLLTSLLLGPLTYLLSPPLVALMGASGATAGYAEDYLRIFALFAPVVLSAAALPLLLRNGDQPSLTTWILCIGALLNLIVGYWLIIIREMGMTGAALATVFAQAVVCLLSLYYLQRDDWPIPFRRRDLRPQRRSCQQILHRGLPSLVMFGYFIFFMVAHNWLFLQHGGVVAVAAFSIASYIFAFYGYFAEGIATGIQPILSYHVGSGQQRRVRATVIMALCWVTAIGGVISAIIYIDTDAIARIFNSDDEQLLQMTVNGLRLHLFAIFLDGIIFVSGIYFQAVHRTYVALLVNSGNIAIQIPMLIILPWLWGVNGIWLAMPISNILIAIPVLWIMLDDLRQRRAISTSDESVPPRTAAHDRHDSD
ncbi:putative MATE family efflux protein [Sinobacterium caligoides]|uniref:Multidrug export protein MepA n=2 Tax=Sinobacterium caligoides TaxID=933926 RepID=A0A3N2DGZ4_9GAMM|nr:putative MATE family efflux protein [Sinobacterium caligoides]